MRILIVNRHRADVVGGSEIQCDQIARALTERGHAPTYAVMEPRRARYELPYPCLPVAPGRAGFRAALAEARAELVYWRFNRRGLWAAAGAARDAGAAFLYALSHDDDTRVWPALADLASPRRAWRALLAGANALACRRVDGFVAQHAGQARGLPQGRTRVIHNSAFAGTSAFAWPRPYVAWVANVKPRKRPERFVELAQALSGEPFDCLAVGALQDRRYAWLADRSRLPARFHYLGARPPEEVNGLIAGARCVVLTCEPEGFPNVLLQAWQLGIPTASLAYDPDGWIATHRLGAVAATVAELATAVRALVADETERAAIAARAQALVAERFSLAANVSALEAFAAERLAARRGT
ncbi:MAG TPA: glycosyltransferase family 4 protein [Planctomycetota bacterium]